MDEDANFDDNDFMDDMLDEDEQESPAVVNKGGKA